MIKIQESMNSTFPDFNLNLKASRLYKFLNPKLKNRSDYKETSLIKKLDKLINESNTEEYKEKSANGCQETLERQKSFYEYLKVNNYQKLKAMIISRPSDFTVLINEVEELLLPEDLFTTSNRRVEQTSFGRLLSGRLFKYSTYRSSQYCVDLYRNLGFKRATCVYCNSQKTSISPKPADKGGIPSHRIKFDLDHFLPKSIYPYLALCFFNHIPSCHSCNSQIKKEKNFRVETHINPYLESFDELYSFSIQDDSWHSLEVDKLSLDNTGIKQNDQTVVDLELEEHYEQECSEVEELIILLRNHEHLLNVDEIEGLKDLLFGYRGIKKYKKDTLAKENSKLYRDIIKSFDSENLLQLD